MIQCLDCGGIGYNPTVREGAHPKLKAMKAGRSSLRPCGVTL